MKKWESFATVAFHAMKGALPLWYNGSADIKRSMTRLLYDQVFSTGDPNKTGYISSDALSAKRKGLRVTKDHILSPQFVARMVYDNADVWLTDFEKFKSLFYMCCLTILVTPQENTKLSRLTENKDGEFKIYVPTHKKYEHLNIVLFHPDKGVVTDVFKDLVPRELVDYEKNYLVEQ